MAEKKVLGNTEGVRRSTLSRIAQLYDYKCEGFIDAELACAMAEFTDELGRELCALISRSGAIQEISIGERGNAELNELRLVRNIDRLSGVRCVHTHPGGSGMLSEIDCGVLRVLKLDAMAAIGVCGGRPVTVGVGYADGPDNVLLLEPTPFFALDQDDLLARIVQADRKLMSSTVRTREHEKERAVLVGVKTGAESFDTLMELAELAKTAGAEVVRVETQNRTQIDNAFYIGRGRAEELLSIGNTCDADIFIFDDELSAAQIRNLEELLGARVIDRSALILDIFAKRAKTREGSLQVELAQLKYRLPRLIGFGQSLSRQGGGIGTIGPGEKKLESDRRRIRRQIYELECELAEVEKQRALRRTRREKNAVPVIAIAGYTNAGKSTLLNALSGSDVPAEDMLFATLDPVTRLVTLPSGTQALFTDTVGFINKLPHELVEAFKSTLEEVVFADVILHVADASSAYLEEQSDVVLGVLDSLGAGNKPVVTAFNKMDKAGARELAYVKNSVGISAAKGEGLSGLLELVQNALDGGKKRVSLTVPHARGDVTAFLTQRARVITQSYTENGCELELVADSATLGAAKKMLSR